MIPPSSIPLNPLFDVVPIPLKELGAIAKVPIPKGMLVLEESPLFLFDAPFAAYIFSRQTDNGFTTDPEMANYSALDAFLGQAVNDLMLSKSENDKRILLELANTHPELPPGYAVFKTNAISTVLSQGGLFPSFSRINSSCRPNLRRPVWDKAAGVIRSWALRDIEVGEELGWSYLDSFTLTIAERKAQTLRILGFRCACPGCTLPTPELRAASDARASRLGELYSQLSDEDDAPLTPDTPRADLLAELAVLREMTVLAEEEGLTEIVEVLDKRLRVAEALQRGPRGMALEDGGRNCCLCCV